MNRLLLFLAVFFGIAHAILTQGGEVQFFCANVAAVYASAISEWFSTPWITSVTCMSIFSTLIQIMGFILFFYIISQLHSFKPILGFNFPAISSEKGDADLLCSESVYNSGFSISKGIFFEEGMARFQLLGINNAGIQHTNGKFLSSLLIALGFGDKTSNPDLTIKYSSDPVGRVCPNLIKIN